MYMSTDFEFHESTGTFWTTQVVHLGVSLGAAAVLAELEDDANWESRVKAVADLSTGPLVPGGHLAITVDTERRSIKAANVAAQAFAEWCWALTLQRM